MADIGIVEKSRPLARVIEAPNKPYNSNFIKSIPYTQPYTFTVDISGLIHLL